MAGECIMVFSYHILVLVVITFWATLEPSLTLHSEQTSGQSLNGYAKYTLDLFSGRGLWI